MATFAKKLHMINSAGTEQTAEIYSTADEAGSPYLNATVDGTAGYIALVDTSDSSATSGRVTTSSGTLYAIGKASTPSYSYTTLTTAGSGTWTVPSGVTKLRVSVVGGGAGGSSGFVIDNGSYASGSCSSPAGTRDTLVGGSASSFGSVSANGGTNFSLSYYKYRSTCTGTGGRDGYTCYKSHNWLNHISTGYHNGTLSTSGDGVGGGAAVPLQNYLGTTIVSVGAGGYADSGNTSLADYCGGTVYSRVCSGASGYRTVSTISVTPGQVISYTVGAGGNWYRSGSGAYYNYEWGTSGHHGSPGATGGILIEWGQGIE